MPTTLMRYPMSMPERRTDKPFVYVQIRVPNALYDQLVRVAGEDNRPIHSELLTMLATWTGLPRSRRLAVEAEAAGSS